MCLIVFAWRHHPDYPLIVAGNRDETHVRPAVAAHWWEDCPDLLAGRDLEGGGTWMGVSRNGRFAALTNYRDMSHIIPGAPTRGLLVRDCLLSGDDTQTTLERVAAISPGYSPFNLLVSDGETLGIHESSTGSVRLLEPGVYGLSNHLLDTPWPKLLRAREHFERAIDMLPDTSASLSLLRDDLPAADEKLPHTGVSIEWERALSPVFIRTPDYGTRCSTVLTINRQRRCTLQEWSWNPAGEFTGERHYDFTFAENTAG